jgi:hypothetical protein
MITATWGATEDMVLAQESETVIVPHEPLAVTWHGSDHQRAFAPATGP